MPNLVPIKKREREKLLLPAREGEWGPHANTFGWPLTLKHWRRLRRKYIEPPTTSRVWSAVRRVELKGIACVHIFSEKFFFYVEPRFSILLLSILCGYSVLRHVCHSVLKKAPQFYASLLFDQRWHKIENSLYFYWAPSLCPKDMFRNWSWF